MTELTARELLLHLYQVAVDAVDGRYLVADWLRQHPSEKMAYTHVVAVGKAAAAMLDGAYDECSSIRSSLLICPGDKLTRKQLRNPDIECIASSHPVPDEKSLQAGEALISFVSRLDQNDKVLFLISGGTSALVEAPVDGLTIEDFQAITRYLLGSGKDIHQMNAWRQQFSRIKGGGLLKYVKCRATQLLISDVKDDIADYIGSGPLVACNHDPGEDDVLCRYQHRRDPVQATEPLDTHIIGNLAVARQAVHTAAQAEMLDSQVHEEFIEGNVELVARQLYDYLKNAPPGIHVWGGEPTVNLPETPGIGGRNQALALYFARLVKDMPGLHLLSAGTDGADGNSNCSGGIVSMHTLQKAEKMGMDVQAELDKANSGMVLMATDDLVPGHASSTNVMDVIIAYKEA